MFWVLFLAFGQSDLAQPPPLPDLAQALAGAYSRLSELSFVATVTDAGRTLRCEVHQRPNHTVSLRVYENRRPIYDFRTVGWHDSRMIWINEHNYLTEQTASYRLPLGEFYDYAKWDIRLTDRINACAFAGYFKSWLGPESQRLAIFREAIAGGELIGREMVSGRPCWIVRDGEPTGVNQRYYLDTETFLILRWTKNRGENLIRDRVFDYQPRLKLAERKPS